MSRPFVLLVLDSSAWFRGRGRGRERLGSWSQCMRKNERGLPMNRVAADVSRRTCLLSSQMISADSRRRLQFSANRFVEVSPRKVVEWLSSGQAQVGRGGGPLQA